MAGRSLGAFGERDRLHLELAAFSGLELAVLLERERVRSLLLLLAGERFFCFLRPVADACAEACCAAGAAGAAGVGLGFGFAFGLCRRTHSPGTIASLPTLGIK